MHAYPCHRVVREEIYFRSMDKALVNAADRSLALGGN